MIRTFGAVALLVPFFALTACHASPPAGPGRVYVASGLTDQVFILDAGDGHVLDTVAVDPRRNEVDEPHGVAVSPDGGTWYATTLHGQPTVTKFDARDQHRLGMVRLDTPGASRIRLTPDGRRALVPDWWRSGQGKPSGLALIGLDQLRVLSNPTLCAAPHDAPVDPSGRWVLVTCSYGDEVLILDLEKLKEASPPGSVDDTVIAAPPPAGVIKARIPAGPDPGPAGSPRYAPLDGAWSPSGDTAWVTLNASHEVLAIDTTGAVLARDTLPGTPVQIATTPDGRHLVIPLRDTQALAILDASPLRLLRLVPLEHAAHPHGVALNRAGSTAFVGFEGSVDGDGGVVAVEVPGGEITWRTEAGRYVLGVAWGPEAR